VPLDTTAANGRRVDADTAQPADGWREEHMPAGVRLFDVSDPLAPVELDAEHPEVVRVATDETAAHDQGEDEPVHNQSA
jgi:hypothetical protein